MNFPSAEHRAIWPIHPTDVKTMSPGDEFEVAPVHNNEGDSRYADAAPFRFPPTPVGTGYVFTQHAGSVRASAKSLDGDLQSVGPAEPDTEQENWSALMRKRYMWRGAVGVVGARVLAGIGQLKDRPGFPNACVGAGYDEGIVTGNVASGLGARVASGLSGEATSFGSEAPSSQPARRSARAEIPKKKFFICCSPFLGYNFPHPERDVKLSFFHVVTQGDKA